MVTHYCYNSYNSCSQSTDFIIYILYRHFSFHWVMGTRDKKMVVYPIIIVNIESVKCIQVGFVV